MLRRGHVYNTGSDRGVIAVLEKRRLGRTNLQVTALSFGGLPMQRCDVDEAAQVLNAALDAGINFIDTARAYTDSEEKIGRAIAGRRGEFYLATKSMARDRVGMARDIDTSLATMRTDHIDLYQVHNVKKQEDLDAVLAPGGALEALQAAQQAGKISHIGVTGHSVPLLIAAIKTGLFATVQVPFNFVEQDPAKELFPLAEKLDVGRIAMKPLGGGQLSHPVLALRFVLGRNITAAIPGMDRVAHVAENLQALRQYRPLTAEETAVLAAEAKELGNSFCRRCGYCMPCTAGIDIPQTFIFYLQYTRYGMTKAIPQRYAGLPAPASACVECGLCEQRCPYNLPIRERMKQIARDLG